LKSTESEPQPQKVVFAAADFSNFGSLKSTESCRCG